jgi:putative membrane protein
MKKILIAAAALALASGPAFAAGDNPDNKVLSMLHMDNQMEMQAGLLAEQKATSPQVKEFAQHIVRDHRETDQQIQSIARKAGLSVVDPDIAKKKRAEQQKILEKLAKAEGQDFDKTYTALMADAHGKAISALKKEREKVQNPELQALLDKTLPVLEQHKSRAEELKRAV